MSLVLCCVRAPFKLALLNWMPLDGYHRETSLKTSSWLIGFQSLNIDHLKQQRQRRLRKRYLKSEFALIQTLSRLFHLFLVAKCWQFFGGWILKDSSIKDQKTKKKVVVLCSRRRRNVSRRRQRLRKRHLKKEFALLQTLSRLFHLV